MHIDIDLATLRSETLLPVPDTTCHEAGIRQLPSKPRHLYFAYGSNLSPTQMRQRCMFNPELSARPLAIAVLHKWRWLICEAGYANVLPPPGMRVGPQRSDLAGKIPVSGEEDAIYGILYDMDARDEGVLDGYEGVDHYAEKADESGEVRVDARPREQGEGDYNKWYLPAEIVQWVDERDPPHPLKTGPGGRVPVLIYVDEERLIVATPKEYIPRMNRAMREAAGVGVSKKWLEGVLRKFIPAQ